MKKITNSILLTLAVIIALITCYLIGVDAGKRQKELVIRDPVVIYDNMKIELMDNRGIYGIISERKLKELIGFKNGYELMKENRKRRRK